MDGPTAAEGGDPACWLGAVCPSCGRFVEDEEAERCPGCGEPRA